MSRSTHHVVKHSGGGWAVRKGGSARASKIFSTKKVAIDAARIISRNQQTELVIHGLNGQIQRSDSHGHDPCPPKDMK